MMSSGKVSAMKDAIWVFKSFGLKAGILFVVGSVATKFKRLIGLAKKPKRFEELSDEEARQLASAFGISPYQGRDVMNSQFNDYNHNRTLH